MMNNIIKSYKRNLTREKNIEVFEKELGLIVKQYAELVFLGKEVIIQSEKADIAAETDSFGRWLVKIIIGGSNIYNIYNYLGVNKKCDTYSEDNVLKLKEANKIKMKN